jgi:3'-phosphoadenosine 5'-phosphosulfate sulfotransferase (PAPS reductase)/FAD synthetase
MPQEADRNWRHILALSGGKDSSALAIYMKTRIPEMEYVFCDTDKELDETYEYLDRLEVYLERKIVRLKTEGMGFDDLLKMRRGFLPSPQMRWCTEYLKIKPYEKYIGEGNVISYVGIRADEMHRKRYISTGQCQLLGSVMSAYLPVGYWIVQWPDRSSGLRASS